MYKKIMIGAAALTFVFCGMAGLSVSADMGAEQITLDYQEGKKPKPAVFPHKAHQDLLECGECHHSSADGKQVAYVEGQEIGKCNECHNKEVLPGVKKGKDKLDTMKGAFHANCLACHKKVAAEDEAKKALKKCATCHPKKKK